MIHELFKKYKTALFSGLVVLLLGICCLIFQLYNKNSSNNIINETSYTLKYDNTWKIKDKKKDIIVLKHSSGSKITIQISELSDDYKYSTMDELIDELIYNLQEQNKNYNLISNNKENLTKYNFAGYKLLYENDIEQVMISVYKKGDKLITIQYEATNDYFDILLDSVHNIIYNLDVKDTKFNLNNSLKMEMSDISYSTSAEIDKLLKDRKTYEIAKNNYLVEYTIPAKFELSSFNSSYNYFDLKTQEGNISMTVDIYSKNIYEYLDKEETSGVYKSYFYYHDNDDYSDFKEYLSKLDNNYDSYIYKNSYYYNKAITYKDNKLSEYKRLDENIELIYALNNNHILIIKIKSTGEPITKKLIDMIEVKSSQNYASYIKVEKEDSYLIGRLQRFADYNKDKIDVVTLKVPDKYEEIDKKENIYLERFYGLSFNEDLEVYDYDVHYELSTLSDENIINSINSVYIKSTYGDSKKLVYTGNLTLNGKLFKVYDGGYTDLSGILFTNINRKRYYVNKKVLFYEIPSGGNLYIEINGNGKKISDNILKETTNFIVEEKNY